MFKKDNKTEIHKLFECGLNKVSIIVEKMHQYFIIPNRPNPESASIAELQSSFSRRALLNLSRIVSREVKLQGADTRSGFAAIPPLRIVSSRNDVG